VNSQDCALL